MKIKLLALFIMISLLGHVVSQEDQNEKQAAATPPPEEANS